MDSIFRGGGDLYVGATYRRVYTVIIIIIVTFCICVHAIMQSVIKLQVSHLSVW